MNFQGNLCQEAKAEEREYMINDALLANPEDRLRDLSANIEEMK